MLSNSCAFSRFSRLSFQGSMLLLPMWRGCLDPPSVHFLALPLGGPDKPQFFPDTAFISPTVHPCFPLLRAHLPVSIPSFFGHWPLLQTEILAMSSVPHAHHNALCSVPPSPPRTTTKTGCTFPQTKKSSFYSLKALLSNTKAHQGMDVMSESGNKSGE